ncbi:MAG: amidohydrolase [Bacillota bacterium]
MLLIKHARIMSGSGPAIDRGSVLVEGERVAAVGVSIPEPPGAVVLDAAGCTITPGLIDAHAHAGIWEEGFGREGVDVNESTDPVTPHLRALDAINPEDTGLGRALEGGVTAIWCAPGSSNIIGGQGVAMRTYGSSVDEMVLRHPCGVKAALGENPKRSYGSRQKSPATRMASAAILRETLVKAARYLEKQQGDKAPDRDLGMEALGRVLMRQEYLRVHAHRVDDILTALRLAREFNIRIVIEHATEAHKIADLLAREEVPVIIGPTLGIRGKVETRERSFATPGVCARAGVQVAIMTDHPIIPLQFLAICAGLAWAAGLPEEDALAAVTINPARILGIDQDFGSLEVGKVADLAIFGGHPFEPRTPVEATVVAGRVVYCREGGLLSC